MKALILFLCCVSANASPVISVTNPDIMPSSIAGNVEIYAPRVIAADTTPDKPFYDKNGAIPDTNHFKSVPYNHEIKSSRTMNLINHKLGTLSVGAQVWFDKGERIRKASPQMNFTYRTFKNGVWGSWNILKCLKTRRIIDECVADAGQYVVMDNGQILVPVAIKFKGSNFRQVSVLRLAYNGDKLRLLSNSVPVTIHQGRGFLEPQLAVLNGKYMLSIRAENGFAYHAQSVDGQHFTAIEKWRFGNGEYLQTSSTQQHFMTYKGHLWLLYVRKTGDDKVVRYRGRLYMAMINSATNTLVKSTETIVFDRTSIDPATTLHFGNFFVNGTSIYCYGINIIDWTGKNFKADIN